MSFLPFGNGKVKYVPRRALIEPEEISPRRAKTSILPTVFKTSALAVVVAGLVVVGASANTAGVSPASVSAPVETAQTATSTTRSAPKEARPIPKVAKSVSTVKPKVQQDESFQAAVVVKKTVAPKKTPERASEAPRKPVVPETQLEGADDVKSGSTSTKDAPKVTGTGKGAAALAFAKKQLGEPYVMNGAGPSTWDCSGLTMRAWGAAGVKGMPHSARQQFGKYKKVSKSNLRPGDLVFFYSPIRHVGIYAGNGKVLHAPRPGKSVEYIPMKYMPYAGAVRPG